MEQYTCLLFFVCTGYAFNVLVSSSSLLASLSTSVTEGNTGTLVFSILFWSENIIECTFLETTIPTQKEKGMAPEIMIKINFTSTHCQLWTRVCWNPLWPYPYLVRRLGSPVVLFFEPDQDLCLWVRTSINKLKISLTPRFEQSLPITKS